MTIISKYVALKNYIPTGLPKEEDFEIKSKTLELDETIIFMFLIHGYLLIRI